MKNYKFEIHLGEGDLCESNKKICWINYNIITVHHKTGFSFCSATT